MNLNLWRRKGIKQTPQTSQRFNSIRVTFSSVNLDLDVDVKVVALLKFK